MTWRMYVRRFWSAAVLCRFRFTDGRMAQVTSILSEAGYYAMVARNWLQLTAHNTWGILNVLDIIWLRPMRGGLIDNQHPFCTGIDPLTGRTIWNSNVIFRTTPLNPWQGTTPPDPDEVIIEKVGQHLRKQVSMAAATQQHPTGPPSPMP